MAFNKDQNSTSHLQQACIDSANNLIKECKLSVPQLTCVKDISSSFIVDLFESITAFNIPDLLSNSDPFADVHNVQAVIDTLSLDLLGISLSHISGDNVVTGDPVAILNLLEILEAVNLHLGKIPKSSTSTVIGSSPKRKISTSTESLESSKPNTDFGPPAKILKRKTCRKTLQKPRQKKNAGENEIQSLTLENILKHNRISKEPQHKSHLSEDCINIPKTNVTMDVEQLHNENFEKKIRTLLIGKHSPQSRCQKLKQSYLRSMKSPLKRKSISSCKKSFLLPHNLRNLRQKPIKKKTEPNTVISVRQRVSDGKEPPVAIRKLLEEFPGFEFQKSSLDLLTRQYYHHLQHMHRQLQKSLTKMPKIVLQAKEAAEQQSKLSNILAKDLKEKNQLRAVKEDEALKRKLKCSFRDARLRSAKIRQYFEEFHSSMQKKLQQRNTIEELVVERTFKKMLDVQREKMQSICKQVKEADELDAASHRQYLETLQNIYEQQMCVLTKIIEEEQKEAADNINDYNMISRKMTMEWRDALQSDVRSLQKDVLDIIRDTHFRELDAQNFIDIQQHKT